MGHAPHEDLTPRELEVLELLKLRRTNKEIAEEMVIEESTVETTSATSCKSLASGHARSSGRRWT